MHGMIYGALVCTAPDVGLSRHRDRHEHQFDIAIRRTLTAHLEQQPWWDSRTSKVSVDNGKVIYMGQVENARTRKVARRIAEGLPGVTSVWDTRVPRRGWQGSL
ncbi:MAG: BON domain-containing protein [Burkholderiales bacterium]